MSKHVIKTYKVAIPKKLYPLCIELNKLSARIYNKTLSLVKKVKQKKGFWLSPNSVQKYILCWANNINIHTHSKQAIVQQYFQALNSYLNAVKKNPNIKPPYKRKKFMPFVWKNTAIKLLPDGKLKLSMGNNRPPIIIQTRLLPNARIRQAKIVYEKEKYFLHIAVEVEKKKVENATGVLAIDLGIIHPMTCYDGKQVIIYNGGILNSKIRYRNKKLKEFEQKLAKCQKNSKKFKKLTKAKKRMLKKVNNQIRDVLEKYTSHLIGYCVKNGIGTIVLGKLNGIRNKAKYGKVSNQKIHQWLFNKIIRRLKEKAKFVGIEVKFVKENGTSKTCPKCKEKNETKNRNYECKREGCGFKYHRDGVGAINIYKKYTGLGLASRALARPVGVRYTPHLCCPVRWNVHLIGKTANKEPSRIPSPSGNGSAKATKGSVSFPFLEVIKIDNYIFCVSDDGHKN